MKPTISHFRSFFAAGSFILSSALTAQQQINTEHPFERNQAQYPSQVLYKTAGGNGTTIFLEKDKFTFVKYDPRQLEEIHDASHANKTPKEGMVNFHAFQMEFIGANPNTVITSYDQSQAYSNFFRGNDPSKWATYVYSFKKVAYENLFTGVNMEVYQKDFQFKYDFIVQPGQDASVIRFKISHARDISIEKNNLIITTSTGDVVQGSPYTYQWINGEKKEVKTEYSLTGSTIHFVFPEGYDSRFPLVIDPVLVAATYSGAPANTITYGHCATYDNSGNIYTGGECFGPGYPTSMGAFQGSFAGYVDISISKFNPNGSAALWASYVGGTSRDIPNSLFVNNQEEIYILGASSSVDYPVTAGCFDNTANGGEDIIVTHFNNTGTSLVGSTYVGGTLDDGGGWGITWGMNGHDAMRGEIIVDNSNNAYVASFTSSSDFPVTPGCYDNALNGSWDACVFRLSGNLSSLQWSTFLGGTSDDGSYGIRLNSNNDIYVTGVSMSNDFPATAGSYDNSHNGGSDGFMVRFNAAGSSVLAATFMGTANNEISYFMDIDQDDDVYAYGISDGVMPVTAGVYSNPGSGNFLMKFNPALSSALFSTVFGDGTNAHLEPEAFMVDVCKHIYISGFGAMGGYPTTPNALYPTSASANGGSCYFMVLDQNAASLSYGSFYFGWHVDGGTSRFDPGGAIYQGICIGGGGATTPAWAYKDNINAPGWDMFVVKIDFEPQGVIANAGASPSTFGCAPFAVNFTNNSTHAVQYLWDFDDAGTTSTAASPSHTFNTPGIYNVMLIAIDSSTCNVSDTDYVNIIVGSATGSVAAFTTQLFSCGTYTLQTQNTSTGAQTYNWNFGDGNTSTALNPSHVYAGTGPWTITLMINDTVCGGADTVSHVIQFTAPVSPLAAFSYIQQPNCSVVTATFTNQSQNAHTYTWNFGDGNTSTQTSPSHTYTNPGNYVVTLTAFDTICNQQDQVQVPITLNAGPNVNIPDGEICQGQPVLLDAGANLSSYLWSTGDTTQTITVTQSGTYQVTVTLGNCTSTETVVLTDLTFNPAPDTPLVCPGKVVLHAGMGQHYLWSTGSVNENITVMDEDVYWYSKQVGYCVVTDTIVLKYRYKSPDVYIPNSFTPNDDGLNETHFIVGADPEEFEFMIFDRWGELIFQSNDPAKGWDGRYKNGKLVPQGTYAWKLMYKNYCMSPVYQTKMGHVNVIR